jgi:threonine dehydrogenase-like Zn-dependent dehydrogenase
MRALIASERGQLTVEQVADPELAPGHVLVRSRVTAVSSGTELRMLYRDAGASPAGHPGWPAIGAFGYLAAGDVIAVGDGVDHLHVGDRVACGRAWGTHREILDVEASSVDVLPGQLSYLDGACAYWAVPPLCGILAGAPRFHDDVAVIGLGPLGLAAVQMLAAFCRRVLAIDRIAARCELAERFGAIAVDGSTENVTTAVQHIVPDGPSVVIQAAGSQTALELALAIVRPRGTVANVGTLPRLHDMDLFWPLQISGAKLVPIHRPGSGSPQGGGAGSPRQVYLPEVFDLLRRGRLDLRSVCSWVLPVELAPRALPFLRDHPEHTLGLAFAWEDDEVVAADRFETALRAVGYR